MTPQKKGPQKQGWHQRILGGRLSLIAALAVLAALLALNNLLSEWDRRFGTHPLDPMKIGEMADFSTAHEGAAMPGVVFRGPEGRELTLAAFRGDAVLLNLWATWCAPCVEELPALDELAGSLKGEGIEVIALNMDRDGEEVAAPFLAELGIENLTLYRDENLLMSTALGVGGIPVTVLYDSRGAEIGRLVGGADWSSPEAVALILKAIRPKAEE